MLVIFFLFRVTTHVAVVCRAGFRDTLRIGVLFYAQKAPNTDPTYKVLEGSVLSWEYQLGSSFVTTALSSVLELLGLLPGGGIIPAVGGVFCCVVQAANNQQAAKHPNTVPSSSSRCSVEVEAQTTKSPYREHTLIPDVLTKRLTAR